MLPTRRSRDSRSPRSTRSRGLHTDPLGVRPHSQRRGVEPVFSARDPDALPALLSPPPDAEDRGWGLVLCQWAVKLRACGIRLTQEGSSAGAPGVPTITDSRGSLAFSPHPTVFRPLAAPRLHCLRESFTENGHN